MNAEEYLNRIRIINVLINNKKIELESLKALCEFAPLNYESEKVQSSSKPDSNENRIINYVELKKELEKGIDDLIVLKKEIINTIDKVDDPKLIDLLYKRYVQCKNWIEISDDTGFTRQWLHQLNDIALEKIEKIINT